jgi:hypothetical protein
LNAREEDEVTDEAIITERVITENGYVLLIFEDGSKEYEHRYLAEVALARRLKRSEEVHHVNRIREDNDLSNLVIMDWFDHREWHKQMRAWAAAGGYLSEEQEKRELIRRYAAPDVDLLQFGLMLIEDGVELHKKRANQGKRGPTICPDDGQVSGRPCSG